MTAGTLRGAWDLPPAGRDGVLHADGILRWEPPPAQPPLPVMRRELGAPRGRSGLEEQAAARDLGGLEQPACPRGGG